MGKMVKVLAMVITIWLSALAVTELTDLAQANFVPTGLPEHTIEITYDGSVVGTDKIKQNDAVYEFTGNIAGNIVVLRNSVIIDGMGYTLTGDGNSTGIYLPGRFNVTLRNLQITNFTTGIQISSQYEYRDDELGLPLNTLISIYRNTITNTDTGIHDLFAEDNYFWKRNT